MKQLFSFGLVGVVLTALTSVSFACTGIHMKAQNGDNLYGRSMEWGAFDLNSRILIIPRNYEFTGLTPDGLNGKKWTSKYGVVAMDMLEKDFLGDGMNEKGLAAGLFYHPSYSEYMAYDARKAKNTITAVDVVTYILTQYATVEEVKKGMKDVRVVPVVEEALGIPIDAHWMVTDANGQSIVIEYAQGQVRFFDNPLGVITNAPNYDWHMTNLRNYINLSPIALPTKKIEEMDFSPLGGGSGMIGLPGDFTPPSRFIRAVAWTQTARDTQDGKETSYEMFRILDNFNLPLGASEGSDKAKLLKGLRSSTLWTTAWDLQNKTLYYHTQHNRRVRQLDLNKVDFSGKKIRYLKMDKQKQQDIENITP